MTAIWCSADRNKAFDAAMKGDAPQMDAPASCKINLDQHYKLGILFGIQGTPAILTDSGMMIPGYRTAGAEAGAGRPEAWWLRHSDALCRIASA